MIAVGLMSGTSLDGIDAALLRIEPRGRAYGLDLLRFETFAYDPQLREELLEALPPSPGSVAAVARLHHVLGEAYARAAQTVMGSQRIDFVASHGQTLWHDGAQHTTLQIGDPFVVREAAGATVCYDFRSADCAAGGQGAPLVAYVDALLLGDAREDRVALNVGGIANLTLLRRGAAAEDAIAFDTGPGNMLLDAFVADRTEGRRRFDEGGEFARAGRPDEALLEAMLAGDFFAQPPPKTTGRERFGRQFLASHAEQLAGLSLQDGAATLTELTAASISQAILRAGFGGGRVIVSGGGARNRTLMERLAARLDGARVEASDAMGIPAEAKEAIAFVVLAYEMLRGRPANLRGATGASRRAVLGAIAPQHLSALLGRIERECTSFS